MGPTSFGPIRAFLDTRSVSNGPYGRKKREVQLGANLAVPI